MNESFSEACSNSLGLSNKGYTFEDTPFYLLQTKSIFVLGVSARATTHACYYIGQINFFLPGVDIYVKSVDINVSDDDINVRLSIIY